MAGADLILKMATGDRRAFSDFYDLYAPLAYGLAMRIVREPADAADVLQEVFWEAWQNAPSYDPARGTPEAWIITRVRSRAIDRVRSIRRRTETFVAPVDEGQVPSRPDPRADLSSTVADRMVVETALGRLPEPQREVITLAYYDGLTQTEIADRLKQPLGTVKTRMRLGLERLREVMGRRQQ